MILFFISVSVYVAILCAIRPAPTSLKSAQLTYGENLKSVWASMVSGLFILFVFLLTTNFNFLTVDESMYGYLALNNDKEQQILWPLQSITHLFIHADLIHLVANVIGLGLASVYERRVGAKRFFTVLLIASLASIPSIFFYPDNITVCGISGGVFGLAAAYFTDENHLSTREWLAAILLFLFLVLILTLDTEISASSSDGAGIKIDHIGHLLGAIGAIIYCRLRPSKIANN